MISPVTQVRPSRPSAEIPGRTLNGRVAPTDDHMDLTRDLVETKAAEYAEAEPLYVVEAQELEGLPSALSDGDYGRRDAEWVVQWFYRRYLGDYPDRSRRDDESAYRTNDFEAVRDAIAGAIAADGLAEKIHALTDLSGVDVPVASAFLQFIDPQRFVVLGPLEWSALVEAGALNRSYPAEPGVDDYQTYLATCRSVAQRLDCELVSVQRALWRLSRER